MRRPLLVGQHLVHGGAAPLRQVVEHLALIQRHSRAQFDEANRVRNTADASSPRASSMRGCSHKRIAAAIISSRVIRKPSPVEVARMTPSSISRLMSFNVIPSRPAAVMEATLGRGLRKMRRICVGVGFDMQYARELSTRINRLCVPVRGGSRSAVETRLGR